MRLLTFQINKRSSAYTLIELLMVMAIIGVLAGLYLVRSPGSIRRARDTNRISDLKHFQTSLESFANRNSGLYPQYTLTVATSTLCTALGFSSPNLCPSDSQDGTSNCSGSTCRYYYQSNSGGCSDGIGCADMYVLWSRLEQPQDVALPYFIVCSDGRSGFGDASSVTGGACPL